MDQSLSPQQVFGGYSLQQQQQREQQQAALYAAGISEDKNTETFVFKLNRYKKKTCCV